MMRHISSLIVRGLVFLSACLGTTELYAAGPYENTTPAGFSNAANPCTGTPLNITINVGDTFAVTDLDVGLVITHNWRLDTQATLTSPSGTSAVILASVDGNSSSQLIDYNVRLDDEAATAVNVNPPHGNDPATPNYATQVQPSNPLSVFDGENALGNWTLSLCDVFAADNGTFARAELIFAGQASSVPPVLSCGASGLRHDWDDHAWPSDTYTQQYSDAGEDFKITITGDIGGLIAETETNVKTPVTSTFNTGGRGTTQNSLLLFANHGDSTDEVTLTIDIGDLSGGTNVGVAELQFEIFDVDFGNNQFHDKVVVTGTNGTSSVTPILSNSAENTVSGNTGLGQGGAGQDSADGTITVTFLERVTQVTVTYGNGPNAPAVSGNQAIAIYDLVTCPVLTAVLGGSKSITTVGGGYALPGNDVIYKITVSNSGTGPTDAGSIELVDAMPTEIDFFRGLPGTDAVTFTETGSTGLDFDYDRDVRFSDAATKPADFSACTYDPANGYDPTVTYICINPKLTMAAGTSFDVEFRAKIK